ncbi:MAG: hypothetical protein IKN15_04970 [Bacteroidaceae bacterium]|nr:hypothetical protein [Bacteroidaceae bacterium]
MSKTKTIGKIIVFAIVCVLWVVVSCKYLSKALDAPDAKAKEKQSTETHAEIYIPVPKNSNRSGYYLCSKYMETQITSPHFECFGSLYSCNGMPVVRCADGTAYFNPTDLKLDGAQLFNHSQIFPMR